jgi:HD superfamily phosphohydrolase
MIIFDPLYGKFELSELSTGLATLPEVRRLSQVRLLNCITPTLATLSELRRYAHTLGVLHLLSIWKRNLGRKYSKKDVDALEVAIILHDVATPPFGHLFEYVLKEAIGWDHEQAALSTLLKYCGPASTGQPIFAGRTPKVLETIEKAGVDLRVVKSILSKEHHLSPLVFGGIDFDNIDNVWRMSWALGLSKSPGTSKSPEILAAALDIKQDGTLCILDLGIPILDEWAQLRRKAYEVLIFDQSTVASQAVLTFTIRRGLKLGLITQDDWILNDESLLTKLAKNEELNSLIQDQFLGQLPLPLLAFQVKVEPKELIDRELMESTFSKALEKVLNCKVWVYVLNEKGSFEKEIRFYKQSGEYVQHGITSRSVVVSIFTERAITARKNQIAMDVIIQSSKSFNFDSSKFYRTILANKNDSNDSSTLDL